MRTKTRYLSNLLATTIFCGAISVAAPAFAQQDEDQTDAPQTGPVESVAQDAGEESIVVTGSRIPQPNLTSTSPVTVVNSQEVRLTGTTRAEDLINSLPQAFASQGANIANGSTGTATVNLRGLGDNRTLVLVNGRRLLPGDPSDSAADINAIPAFMIERVDVLTGGASSVYGADAVAGVVNFIMDTDFEGIRIDSQYSFYQHENNTNENVINALNARGFGFPTGNVADGGTWDIGVAFGVGFDDGRGHITAYGGYRNIGAVLQQKRDYSACNLSARTAAQVAGANPNLYTCGGSATSNPGTIIAYEPTGANSFTSTVFQIGPNRTLIPNTFVPYNFGPTNYYQRPDERYTAGLFAEYEISEALQPYMEFMFMDDRTVAQIAPSGDFGNTFSLNCNNPLLSAQQLSFICAPFNLVAPTVIQNPNGTFSLVQPSSNAAAAVATVASNTNAYFGNPLVPAAAFLPATFVDPVTGLPYQRGFAQILRRNTEGGPRRDDLQHTEYRMVFGMRGDLDPVWSYDIFYQYGRTNFAQTYQNDFSVTRLARALDVIDNPNTPGIVDPVCRSFITGDDLNCVPWDIFSQSSAPSAAANAYLSTPGFTRGIVEQTVANASITGSLGEYGIQFPWASSGVGVAVGVEYRKEALDFNSDTAFRTGDLAGQGAATLPVQGEYDVREAFAEARIPIVEESFIHELSLELGYRYSDYGVQDRSFSTDTYKIAGFFAPVRDVRFRGGYNRAVRAPNIQELFAPQRVVLDGVTDPCSGFVITAADVGCLAQGLTVGQTIAPNPAAQYNGLIGGEINLEPEVADTWTAGVVIQPRFIPRLAITVDWFDIQIDNAISQIGADTILGICTESADPFFCGLVNRDQFGSLWRTSAGFVSNITQNIGGLSTRGIDVGASYAMDIGTWGNVGLNFQGTWLDELVTDTGTPSGSFDCTGLYGNVCGTPNPEWRHTARVSYTHPDGYGLSLRWRYFDAVTLDALDDNPNLQDTSGTGPAPGGVARPSLARIPSQSYFDLAATFRVGDHFNFRLGVNNILDKDPPLTGSQACPPPFCNGNTWANVYDALGRYIYAGVTLNF